MAVFSVNNGVSKLNSSMDSSFGNSAFNFFIAKYKASKLTNSGTSNASK